MGDAIGIFNVATILLNQLPFLLLFNTCILKLKLLKYLGDLLNMYSFFFCSNNR